jgi:hypothetical protein
MKFQIKHMIDGSPVVTETPDILEWCAGNNVALTGLMRDHPRWPELNGLPLLRGFVGPFRRGKDTVRYMLLQ